jgi:uncharacterized protein
MMANDTDLRWLVERIVALYDPDRIYLFGSYAKGTAHDGSDLDLLVVRPSPLPRAHRGKDLIAVLSTFPSRFDVLFYTPQELEEELRDPYSFAVAAMATARCLYAKLGTAFDARLHAVRTQDHRNGETRVDPGVNSAFIP